MWCHILRDSTLSQTQSVVVSVSEKKSNHSHKAQRKASSSEPLWMKRDDMKQVDWRGDWTETIKGLIIKPKQWTERHQYFKGACIDDDQWHHSNPSTQQGFEHLQVQWKTSSTSSFQLDFVFADAFSKATYDECIQSREYRTTGIKKVQFLPESPKSAISTLSTNVHYYSTEWSATYNQQWNHIIVSPFHL